MHIVMLNLFGTTQSTRKQYLTIPDFRHFFTNNKVINFHRRNYHVHNPYNITYIFLGLRAMGARII